MHITSAAGVISLLDEPEDELKVYALNRLNDIVPEFWPEISDHVEKIEVLYEDETFKHREISALLASKLYYYLGSYEDSLNFALCAGDAFNVKESSEYVVTTICKCIDHYTKLRQQIHDAKLEGDMAPQIDPRLETIVNRMFDNCLVSAQFKQAIGIAIETKRLDILEKAIRLTPNLSEVLSYCTHLCTRTLQHKGLREDILRLLVRLHSNLAPNISGAGSEPDYINICQCLIYLDDPASVSDILRKLLHGDQDQVSLAYQIAFDLYDSASQHFLSDIVQALNVGTSSTPATEKESEDVKPVKKKAESSEAGDSVDKTVESFTKRLARILSGDESIELHLQFFIRNNHTDLQILKNTKDQVFGVLFLFAYTKINNFCIFFTKMIRHDRDNVKKIPSIQTSLLNVGGGRQQVVVLRSRSQSSTSYPADNINPVGQNFTVLKRISIPRSSQGQFTPVSPRKRSAIPSQGNVLLSVVPEKQIKLNIVDKPKTVESGNPANPQLKIGTNLIKSPMKPNISQFVGQPGKSFVLKNTKKGLILVSDKIVTKPATNASTTSTKTGKSESKVVKGLSQQQLVSLKALQTALLGAGVSINKPVQVKLEKPQVTQANKPASKPPQFVLTTVTNNQGKQQLALVSTDQVKPKPTVPYKDSVLKSVLNQEPTPTPAKPKENLPFFRTVANTVMKHKLNDLIDDTLPLIARHVPLVQKNHSVQNLPFSAETESEFLDWNIGKQRASEWQRASLSKRILEVVKEEKSLDFEVPSKRFIVNWFLKHGYSVFTDEFDSSVETSSETKPDKGAEFKFNPTITSHKIILEKDSKLVKPISNCDDDLVVDVESLEPLKLKTETDDDQAMQENVLDVKNCQEFRTPEVLAVEALMKKIEIKLASVPVSNDVIAPLTQAVIAKALGRFCEDLLRETLACAVERQDGPTKLQRILPETLLVEDVIQSVTRNNKLSIVSDKFMGV